MASLRHDEYLGNAHGLVSGMLGAKGHILSSLSDKSSVMIRLMAKGGYVYIFASVQNDTIDIVVASGVQKRLDEHRAHAVKGFTDKYNVSRLVWYEQHDNIESAIQREKQLKSWRREWKLKLIENTNPEWNDLAEELF